MGNNWNINILLGEKDVVGKMKEIIQTVSGIGYSAPVESTTSAPDTAETFVESITPEIPEPNRDGSTIESLTCCCCAEGRCDL